MLDRVGAALALLCCGAAGAHHSFPVHFVPESTVTVSGVVTEFTFRNPHGLVHFDVRGDDGAVESWRAETNSPNILRRREWSANAVQPGDEVTIEGYPARDGSNFMRIYRLTFSDGRELIGQRPDLGATSDED